MSESLPQIVGFTGSRSLAQTWSPLVVQVVAAVQRAGCSVAVGCAAGADQVVRQAAPQAQVFDVAQWRAGMPARAAFVRRSVALVQAVAASGSGAGLVGFVGGPCPDRLFPSASSSACFSGKGSGTWATLAHGVGLGLSVVVFWCCAAPFALPAWPGGAWQAAGAGGVWAQGWRFVPAIQAALF